jgi:hypothetical protein
MISTLDLLYLVLAICSLVITCILVLLGVELIRTLRDIRQISHNVEQITSLMERISTAIFPGIERIARRAERAEEKLANFLSKKLKN